MHEQTSFLKSIFSHILEEWVLNARKNTIIVLGKGQFDERLYFQFLGGEERNMHILSFLIKFSTPTNTAYEDASGLNPPPHLSRDRISTIFLDPWNNTPGKHKRKRLSSNLFCWIIDTLDKYILKFLLFHLKLVAILRTYIKSKMTPSSVHTGYSNGWRDKLKCSRKFNSKESYYYNWQYCCKHYTKQEFQNLCYLDVKRMNSSVADFKTFVTEQ